MDSAFNVISLCAGVESLGLAIKTVVPRSRTRIMVEREAFCCEVLVTQMENGFLDPAFIWTDLLTFDGRPFVGCFDMLVAGFPCQPWSAAGKRKGVEDGRWIWPDIARIIREIRPNFVFLENVPGLISGGGLACVLGSLVEAGYDAVWDCFTAFETGAPHKRERVFILAVPNPPIIESLAGNIMQWGWAEETEQIGMGSNGFAQANASFGGGELAEEIISDLQSGRFIGESIRGIRISELESRDNSYGCGPKTREKVISDTIRAYIREAEAILANGTNGVAVAGTSEANQYNPEQRSPAQCFRIFPPDIEDIEEWRKAPIKPCTISLANGMAGRDERRVDRLRAIGNGVCILEAAYAFLSLSARMGIQWAGWEQQ